MCASLSDPGTRELGSECLGLILSNDISQDTKWESANKIAPSRIMGYGLVEMTSQAGMCFVTCEALVRHWYFTAAANF